MTKDNLEGMQPIGRFAAMLAEQIAKRAAWAATPEGAEEIALQEVEDARRKVEDDAREASEKHRTLMELCDERGIPRHPGARGVAIATTPTVTAAMRAIARARVWRRTQTVPGLSPPPVTLVLAGPPGCGKTSAASRSVVMCRSNAKRILAREIAVLPENDWSENVAARSVLATIALLVIDEAGLEESARAGARVGALIAERTDNACVTIVCTNLDAETFVARYIGDRLVSRLSVEQGMRGRPGGLSWWVDLPDSDLRDSEARDAIARRNAEPGTP